MCEDYLTSVNKSSWLGWSLELRDARALLTKGLDWQGLCVP